MKELDKIILIGHPGSQKIVPASKYLVDKYLPGFNQYWLNYEGPIEGWSKYLASHLKMLDDKYIIFALDDYLLNGPMEFQVPLPMPNDVVCAKLCKSTPEEHLEYPITTQYAIWDREFLIELLSRTGSPWDFEINGSKYFPYYAKKSLLLNCMNYDPHSCLSPRWEGVKLDGLNEEDIKKVKELL